VVPTDHPLVERILDLIPINGLDADLQQEVLAKGEVLEFKRRRTLFEIGARDAYTFYLLDGELELESENSASVPMRAGDDNARRALAQLQPRRYTARARSNVQVFRIERAMLDYILSDEQVLERNTEMQVDELETTDPDADWMSRLLSSALFARLPPDNIQKFFAELQPIEVAAGDVIVEQGTEGDYLYIIAEGQCVVTRRAPRTGQDVTLATLREGDSFGEEALISNTPRNASVSMVSGGFLMRLSKDSFEELVSKPALRPIPWSEARERVEKGAQWLDVRFVDEHEASAIVGSRNVPLNLLRLEIPKLERERGYVLYCDTGARSSTGAFLLTREGLDAYYLAGGLDHIPDGEQVPLTGSAAAAPPPSAEHAVPAQPTPAPVTTEPASVTPAGAPPTAAAVPAEPPASPAIPPPPPEGDDSETLRQQVVTLREERDRAARAVQQASEAARELKRRFDELYRAAQQERGARLTAEKSLAAAQAESQRRASLEEARLTGELQRLETRLKESEQVRRTELEASSQSQARVEEEAARQRAESARLQARLKELEDAHLAQEVELRNSLSGLKSEADAHRSRADEAEAQLSELRQSLQTLQAEQLEQARSKADLETEVEQRLEAARERLAGQGKELEGQRQALARDRDELVRGREEIDREREALTRERDQVQRDMAQREQALQQRAGELDARETALGDERTAAEIELARRAEAIAAEDARLSEDKLAWQERVDEAIETERRRLESDGERFRLELTTQARKDLETLLQQREAELRAEFDAHLVARESSGVARAEAVAAQARQRFEQERASLAGRMTDLTRVYDIRLAEQAAMLQEEQRQLATQTVRLREALNETERLKQDLRQARGAEAPAAAAAPPRPPSPPSQPRRDVPVLDSAAATTPRAGVSDERQRVLSADQISAIRRKMQEKLEASRQRAQGS
jgi:CRP-like cAMP-binding protein